MIEGGGIAKVQSLRTTRYPKGRVIATRKADTMRSTLPRALALSCLRWVVLWAIASAAVVAHASVPTLADCLEGADFIANAARSRDNGTGRETFLNRMADDFVVIRSFLPALRWFAKDVDDERFLLDASARVYDRPRPPAQHHAEFLAACFVRLGGDVSPSSFSSFSFS